MKPAVGRRRHSVVCVVLGAIALLDLAACGDDTGPTAAKGEEDAAAEADAAPMDAAPMQARPMAKPDASSPFMDASPGNEPADSGASDAGEAGMAESPRLPEHCATATNPPATLDCTGLYLDVEAKTVFPGVRGYAPAYALWSDGAEKARWISLPDGSTIDNSDRNEWVFPVGTKLFKEFSRGGKRIETRLWQKAGKNFWVNAVYAWNEDETEADRSSGGDITLADGSSYHIPTQDECEKCHRGRTERILGFDQVLLGLAGAEGVTLATLVEEHRLSNAPDATELSIGDDGSGVAPEVLGWLHANCGITCHNGNSRAIGYPTGMRLRLDPAELDGRAVGEFEVYATTIGVAVTTANWAGQTRIVPGRPEQSLLYRLITTRGRGMQMPPFATNEVDSVNSALVRAWIQSMPVSEDPDSDAGPSDDDDAGTRPMGAAGFGGLR